MSVKAITLCCYASIMVQLEFTQVIVTVMQFITSFTLKVFLVSILTLSSAMAPTATFGIETGNAHFGRAAFPLQGWLSMTNNLTEGEERKPIKLVTHFIAENGIAANHHFTLTAFAQWLDLQVTEDQYDSSRLEKLVLLSDGSSSQNWYYLLLHSLHFNHHIGLTTFLGIWFGSLTI